MLVVVWTSGWFMYKYIMGIWCYELRNSKIWCIIGNHENLIHVEWNAEYLSLSDQTFNYNLTSCQRSTVYQIKNQSVSKDNAMHPWETNNEDKCPSRHLKTLTSIGPRSVFLFVVIVFCRWLWYSSRPWLKSCSTFQRHCIIILLYRKNIWSSNK